MNYYELLEITPNASKEVIKAAYKAQVAKYHPDNRQTGNAEKMQEINIAYETLSDPEKRKKYDEMLGIGRGENKTETKQQTEEINQEKQEEYLNKLKWYLSIPVILLTTIIFFPIGIILFLMRCVTLKRNKDIYHRKRKIANTWVVVGICIAFVCLAFMTERDSIDSGEKNVQANLQQNDTQSIDEEDEKEEPYTDAPESDTQMDAAVAEETKNDIESLYNSTKQYAYYENPYYLDGLQEYVNFLNLFYDAISSEQRVEVVTLDKVLKEAGVSKSFRKKIAQKESTNVLEDKDFVRVEEKQERKLFSSKPLYFEVSSKAKDDIGYENGIIFYIGKLKNNKPNGEGAFFTMTENGTKLGYAGKFKDGRMNGKGVLFSSGDYGYCVTYIGNFTEGYRDGKGTIYAAENVGQTYNNCVDDYLQIEQTYLEQYEQDEKNKVLEEFVEEYPYLKIAILSNFYAQGMSSEIVKSGDSVILPVVKYEGELKKENYNGNGKLYGGLGTIWYDGEFKRGVFHGSGTLYYAGTGVQEYKGNFKNGKYNGKGKLYNDDGSVRKKGEFKNEEPDAEQEMQEAISIADNVEMRDAYEQTLQQVLIKNNLYYYDYDDGENEDSFYYEDEDDDFSYYDEELIESEDSEDEYEEETVVTPDDILLCSDEELYTEEDLEQRGLSAWECRIARNEIYARHGKIFQDAELQEYFESMYWYEPSEDFSEDELNGIERHNLEAIVSYEEKMGYR